MIHGKVWYIPGWATPRDGDCALVRELRAVSPLDVVWLPDYGRSEWSNGESCETIYGHALGRLESEPEPVVIVGWSLGGMAAIELAAAQPSKVRMLVLLSTTARFCSDSSRPFGPSVRGVEAMMADPGRETIRRFLISCYHPLRPRSDELDRMTTAALEASPDQLRLGLAYLLRADIRSVLKDILIPVLLAHGERDAIVPLAAAEEMARLLPNARLRVLPGAGHMLPEANAEEIVRLMKEVADD